MVIWFTKPSPAELNKACAMTMVQHVGIEFLEVGDNYIKAKMPVDHRTNQPDGLLHGGASVVLAETLGSAGARLTAAVLQRKSITD